MRHLTARTLFFMLFWAAFLDPARAAPPALGTTYVLGKLNDVDTIAVSTALYASDPSGVVLFESERSSHAVEAFLHEWKPRQITKMASSADLWPKLFPSAAKVVVCNSQPRGQLLQAACLAGVLKAPLLVSDAANSSFWRKQLEAWDTSEIYAIGKVASFWKGLGIRTYRLPDEAAVQASYLRHALKQGPINALVVANPFDHETGKGSMSALAPWITLQKHGLLLLTGADGRNVKALVEDALNVPKLKAVDALILAGNLEAIPMEKRPNPLAGKDQYIEAEPLTSFQEPMSFATGRLFHDDPAVVALMLARPLLWQHGPQAEPEAVVVSNPGGGLPLLETFSRNTALELRNRGFRVNAFFNRDANRADVRAALPKQTVFLWEGHHSTLIRDYEVHDWSESLRPSLIFLQSCLALEAAKALPFLQRGAIGVLGSSSRTFSGSGGALSLSYFDALIYEKQSVGAALRHAKNFLLCFALLKEKRLGPDTRFTGANLRTALAFTLWGDPTVHLPLPPVPEDAKAQVAHHLHGQTLTISLPRDKHATVATTNYQAQIRANARLAGLLAKTEAEEAHPLIPLIFREIHFPKAPADKTPRLHGRLPESYWVFTYDARRATGYLLIRPRARDVEEIRFTVAWH